jgi:(p)ppGpp synthase/HD superfamily hydrolase
MDEMANFGIAAHWFYKLDSKDESPRVASRVGNWIKELLEIQQQAGNPLEFIEHVKSDLFPDEVYVFTPKGRIIQLPNGATPVDFAYMVHTDIGNTCIGCRINGRLAPLSEPLQSGQVIQITTAPKGQPHPGWLDFVVTAKARSAIRHNLKKLRLDESVQLGRRMLNKVLIHVDKSLDEIPERKLAEALKEVHQTSLDDVLQQIGLGDRVPIAFAKLLLETADQEKLRKSNPKTAVVIDSAEGHVISFARCCHPIPGDPIIGHFSSGRGLVVHRENCRNVAELLDDPEQCTPIAWSTEPTGDFVVELWVEVNMFRGVIAELATRISEKKAGIENISIEERGANISVIKLSIRVVSRVHLADIMKRIRHLSYVQRVRRGKNS